MIANARRLPVRLFAPAAALVMLTSLGGTAASADRVTTLRVPQQGIQPQVAVDHDGVVHMIYFRGHARSGDVFYVRSEEGGRQFTRPLRVNSHQASVIAMGNVRGAHLALGRPGSVHVAWMGSDQAQPKGPGGETPMLYTRLDDDGTAFETERNVIQSRTGLDGGGSLAADGEGNVYVTWHAFGSADDKDEGSRRIWVARSSDDGHTFGPEEAAFDEPTGACGCCGMRALADREGQLYILYRSAAEVVNRDMYLLFSSNQGADFAGLKVDDWKVDHCVMSTAALGEGPHGVLAAWETEGQVYYARFVPAGGKTSRPVAAPGRAAKRKHPVVAANAKGEVILAWTEGMDWNQGGSAAWQVFDRQGRPISGAKGEAPGVPAWSLVAVFAHPNGGFSVIY